MTRMLRIWVLAVSVLLVGFALALPVAAQGEAAPVVFNVDGVEVVVVDAGEPDYAIDYCGVNYVDVVNSWTDLAPPSPAPREAPVKGVEAAGASAPPVDAEDVWGLFKEFSGYLVTVDGSEPLVVLDWAAGAVKVVVRGSLASEAERIAVEMASELAPTLKSWGINKIIVYRGLSDHAFKESLEAAESVVEALNRVLSGEEQPPPLLDEAASRLLSGDTGAGFSVAPSILGAVKILLYGIQPEPGDAEELVKWIREQSGVCGIPFYIYITPEPREIQLAASGPHGQTQGDAQAEANGQASGHGAPLPALPAIAFAAAAAAIALTAARQAPTKKAAK